MSKSFGEQRARKDHLLRSGGLGGEIADLRADVEEGMDNNEARAGFPELDWIDGTPPAAAGGTVVLKGRNLLQGQTFDSLTLGAGTSELIFTAVKPGDSGFKVLLTDTGSISAAFANGLLTVGHDAGVSTADAVATAINVAATNVGQIRCVSGGVGTAIVPSTDSVDGDALVGGVGDHAGNKVEVSGVEALPLHATGTSPAATWADDAISVVVPDLTAEGDARAASDIVATRIQSNGVQSAPISSVLG